MKISKKIALFSIISISLAACNNAPTGEKVEAKKAEETTHTNQTSAASWAVNTSSSVINWEGSKPNGKHAGVIKLKEGSVKVENGTVTGGSFVLDMPSISVEDLKGDDKAKLEKHLKTDDFFKVEKYPTGKFEITGVKAVMGKADATHEVTGNLTMLDSTKSVTIPTKITLEGGKLTAVSPSFVIDRTAWGIKFMSKTFDAKLKEKFLNDNIGLQLNLTAEEKK